jgi:hypothetical protein
MNMSIQRTLVVVLGMHRSGTSVITRAMETMGADLGSKLGSPVAGVNDKGFFEDVDIVGIDEAVLGAAGGRWDDFSPINLDKIEPAKMAVMRAHAATVLREKCKDKIFAVKDPRIPRLLPFWQPVFDQLGLQVVYVIAVRNPVSVGRSLEKRDGFALDKSYRLWLAHMVPALRATEQKPRVLVDYDRLMEAPLKELERISEQLGLPLAADRASSFSQEFLDNGLRHWHFKNRDLAKSPEAPREVTELFSALQAASTSGSDQQSAALKSALARGQQYLDTLAALSHEQLASNTKPRSILSYLAAPLSGLRRRTPV